MEKKFDRQPIEPIRHRDDFVEVGGKYTWTRFAYLVEVKQKEKDRDLCKVEIIKESKRKDSRAIAVGTTLTVFQKDLRELPDRP